MEIIRFTPAVRLSLGLVLLTLSILVLAQALGLTHGNEDEQLQVRQNLAETLAMQAALAIKRNDNALLQATLENAVERNPEMLSAAVRRNDDSLWVQTERHESHWQKANSQSSTPTHVRLPLISEGTRRGTVEFSFQPLGYDSDLLLGLPNFVALVIFVAISAFVGFWFYIKRALHHLDPSAVVPARVRNALNILAEGVLILDKREQIVLVNKALMDRLKRDEKSLIGRKASSLGWLVEPVESAVELPWVQALITGERQVGARLLLQHSHSNDQIFRVNAVPILDGKGKSQGVIASFDDISELEMKNNELEKVVSLLAATQKSIEAKNKELHYLASRDPLTDCYNRRSLFEHLKTGFARALAGKGEYACIMADIDHFKAVNDTYGHSVGDAVIKLMSNTIKETVRDGDIVARFGGEEFCILLPRASLEQATAIAERCREMVAGPNSEGVRITSSFGVASIKSGANSPEELVQQADEALYFSKEHGRNRVTTWSPGMTMKSIGSS